MRSGRPTATPSSSMGLHLSFAPVDACNRDEADAFLNKNPDLRPASSAASLGLTSQVLEVLVLYGTQVMSSNVRLQSCDHNCRSVPANGIPFRQRRLYTLE
ncbi:unnamed protein product [Tuber aestivum]|uniref:Uncharacterized protein n=1 Tax=Tuber aestivum TaxID=59557 RepID=A0A292PTQ0_9PEZI|nr:unnamed protein product [Tuber aestivum]